MASSVELRVPFLDHKVLEFAASLPASYKVDLMELRDGLVHRETVYWAPPFEAPDWRRPFVELPPED